MLLRKQRLGVEEKEWEETTIITIHALGKFIKAFLSKNKKEIE